MNKTLDVFTAAGRVLIKLYVPFVNKQQDQWMTSKSSAGKPEVNSGGMKPSASAPSSLPSAKSSHSSLFVDADDEDDDDLFSPKQESRYSALSF